MILKLVPVQHITVDGYIGYENVLVERDRCPYFLFHIDMLYEPNSNDSELYNLLSRGKTVEVEVRLDIVDGETS